ncbi:AAA family ATPase [Hydrogenophaga sp. PAMC20947]|uniref:ExeA family protein n=1 Tax=Hydrogenophaga sp. PAMC20947 TaxID=2565558 RepID=UPI00109E07CC|nr:AAA family ATPase [Hydrogenophaga sp. PAMC20947]QCB45290.1 AAA family ATPase [Hydrogenophaga sp. PAMC20947]
MYAAFFGLTQPPFSIAPDPRYLYLSERHREALAHLLYGMESGGGFVLLTGEIGAGKTTVCRAVLEQLPAQARVAYIFNPKLTVGDLLQTICHEFGVAVHPQGPGPATIKDYLDPLNAHLLASHAAGEHNVLIIDEAQSLSPDVLEQLRLLTNLETNERKLLQIILIGQPELRQMLARPELEQLTQRVIARFHLGALNESETGQYVAHRLAVAGWKGGAILEPDALRLVFKLTGGVPRRINLLCDRALLGAYASKKNQVSAKMVQQAASEVFGEQPHQGTSSRFSANRFGWGSLALGALAGAVAAGALAWWWQAPAATGAVAAVANSAQPALASPSTKAETPSNPKATSEESENSTAVLEPNLDRLPPGPPPKEAWIASEDEAFRALGLRWGTTLVRKEPCLEAREHRLQCYRTPRMTVNGLRQLDRPAALKLQLPGQGSGFVLATTISDTAVELSNGSQQWRMPLTALSSVWSGYYVTLWRTPPGQQGRLNNGFVGPAAEWMEARLDTLQAAQQLPATAKTLKDKVEAFQAAQGLEVNGRASPTTLIMINRATGVEEPRLALAKP